MGHVRSSRTCRRTLTRRRSGVRRRTGLALLVSAFGDIGRAGRGGGLYAVRDSHVERIDRVSTTGLAYDAGRVARVLRARAADGTGGEVVVYDTKGVKQYLRLDEASAAHDVAWDGDRIVIVSARDNAVRWFAPTGAMVREIRFEGPLDKWHVNCLARRDGEWYVTMFGPIGPFSGRPQDRAGKGRLVHLETGREIAGGFTAPHSPRWFEGSWLVCDSGAGELVEVDESTKSTVRRARLGDWTRGLAWDDNFLYIGVSNRRGCEPIFAHAHVSVLDRTTWSEVERLFIPSQEIYDVAFVPDAALDGLRRGFNTEDLRRAEFHQYAIMRELGVEEPRSLWPSGEVLPWSDFRCSIAAPRPTLCHAGSTVDLPVRLTNESASFFTSTPPAPVFVSYKWTHPQTGAYLTEAHAQRTRLPRTLFPGESIDLTALLVVPSVPGAATLCVTLLQEGVSWFDEQDPQNAVRFEIDILPMRPVSSRPSASTEHA